MEKENNFSRDDSELCEIFGDFDKMEISDSENNESFETLKRPNIGMFYFRNSIKTSRLNPRTCLVEQVLRRKALSDCDILDNKRINH